MIYTFKICINKIIHKIISELVSNNYLSDIDDIHIYKDSQVNLNGKDYTKVEFHLTTGSDIHNFQEIVTTINDNVKKYAIDNTSIYITHLCKNYEGYEHLLFSTNFKSIKRGYVIDTVLK